MTDDDDSNPVRAVIERPIAELVALGLEGGERSARRLLAFQYIIKMSLAGDIEGLLNLREEIDRAVTPASDEPVH